MSNRTPWGRDKRLRDLHLQLVIAIERAASFNGKVGIWSGGATAEYFGCSPGLAYCWLQMAESLGQLEPERSAVA